MTPRRPIMIGLTGGIGSGKSTALGILARKGVPCLQTDRVVHRLLAEPSVVRSLRRTFGGAALKKNGGVDRGRLARIVFASSKKRKVLNGLLHPLVRRRVAQWAAALRKRARRPPVAVVEVPLLFEGGYDRWFDGCLCLSSPRGLRHRRLLGRGWSMREVRMRERSQWPPGRKAAKADWVVVNRGTRRQLEMRLSEWLDGFRRDGTGPEGVRWVERGRG